MAEGNYDHLPEWDEDEYPDDDNADQTTPFFPNGASTPYQAHAQEEMEMKTFKKKWSSWNFLCRDFFWWN